jgi:C-terminal processing protease CtpA/Prc
MLVAGWRNKVVAALALVALTSGCGDSPFDFDEPRSCDPVDQNEWVYGVMQQIYLFADELPQVDPADYSDPATMLRDLRVSPDRWSRVSDKATTEALFEEGAFLGLGFSTRRDLDDALIVSFVIPDSPAGRAGFRRGDAIAAIGGLRIAQIDTEDLWSEIYGENLPGVSVEVTVDAGDGDGEMDVTLSKEWLALQTVPVDEVVMVDDRPVGYLLFSSFVEPADGALDAAFERLADAGVHEIIVDLRYNGGGLLSVAHHLIGLLVGDLAHGRTAYRVEYNEHFEGENKSHAMSRYAGSIPDVQHVVFITTGSTLSASELVINAVRPYVEVSVVGDLTGGKPVGSRHIGFCDKVLAPITFKVVNADGEGDYFDGIAADCAAGDDLAHELGDPTEGALAAAMSLLADGSCPAPVDPDAAEITAAFDVPLAAGTVPPAPTRQAPLRPGAPEELRGIF